MMAAFRVFTIPLILALQSILWRKIDNPELRACLHFNESF